MNMAPENPVPLPASRPSDRMAPLAITIIYLVLAGIWLAAAWHAIPSLLENDALGYFKGARNLLQHGIFSEGEKSPLYPISFRTPGYPCFLALIFRVAGFSLAGPVLANAMLLLGTGLLTRSLVLRLGGGRRAAFVAALMVSLNPLAFQAMLTLTTETLFTALFVAAMTCWAFAFEDGAIRPRWLLGCACLVGLLPLIRPVALYPMIIFLFFLGAMTIWIVARRRGRVLTCWMALGALLATLPSIAWMARNDRVFGDFYFCELGALNLRVYHANAIRFQAGEDRVDRYADDFNTFFPLIYEPRESPKKLQDRWSREAVEIFKRHPMVTLRATVKNFFPIFTPSLNIATATVGIASRGFNGAPGLILRGRIVAGLGRLREAGLGSVMMALLALAEQAMLWGILALFVMEICRGFSRWLDPRLLLAAMVLVMLLLSMLSGAAATSRFRLPLWPVITAVAMASPLPARFARRRKGRE